MTARGGNPAEDEGAGHFDGRRFFNPQGNRAAGLRAFLRWRRTARPEPSPAFVDDVQPSVPPRRTDDGALRATLVNHSTALLQQDETCVLTDPIWSERAGPVSWAGPRRRRAPGVRFADLPRADAVLVSHNHYDHLDLPTLHRLSARGAAAFVVPSGVGRLLRSAGIGPVHEMDWGGALQLPGLTVHCVPAVHFSSRGLFDRNATLWCGFAIEFPRRLVYFAGDTAFGSHFGEIRARFGPPNLALLPVGAYEPRWFMSPMHMSPDEAVRAHAILGARTAVAIHHGTFQLGDDGIDTPKRELAVLAPESFLTIANGGFLEIP